MWSPDPRKRRAQHLKQLHDKPVRYRQPRGHEVDDADRESKRDQAAVGELREIAAGLGEIKSRLGKPDEVLRAETLDELADRIRPFIALKDTRAGNRPYPGVRAVKL